MFKIIKEKHTRSTSHSDRGIVCSKIQTQSKSRNEERGISTVRIIKGDEDHDFGGERFDSNKIPFYTSFPTNIQSYLPLSALKIKRILRGSSLIRTCKLFKSIS